MVITAQYFQLAAVHVKAAFGTSDRFYGVVGGSITLVGFVNITGNPEPQSMWEFNGTTARGDTTERGQLTITNLVAGDSGNYTNTLTNTLNGADIRSINHTVELQVLGKSLVIYTAILPVYYTILNCSSIGPPTAPRNLKTTDIGFNFVALSWQNPSNPGTVPFSMFMLELVSLTPPSPDVNNTFTVTNTDPSFTDTFTVRGLKPNSSYTARVWAVSTHPAVGGPFSTDFSFTTVLGR